MELTEGYADGYEGYDDDDDDDNGYVKQISSAFSPIKSKHAKVKLFDANLGQIADIFATDDLGLIKLTIFFKNEKYQSIDSNVSCYIHNILQFQLKNFLKSKGYKITDHFCVSRYSATVEPRMNLAYRKPNKSFILYKKAYVFKSVTSDDSFSE